MKIFASLSVGLLAVAMSPLQAQSPLPINKPKLYPAWWFKRNVIVRTDPNNQAPDYHRIGDYPAPNDFAPLTQGQLKNLAVAAYDEFRSAAGVNGAIVALAESLFQTDPSTGQRQEKITENTSDHAPVTLGQLKAVAKPFYDEMIGLKMIPGYPWDTVGKPASDFSMATLGQAKQLFFFDLTQFGYGGGSTDPVTNKPGWEDGNPGWPNTWLAYFHTDFAALGGPDADADVDGLTNLDEVRMGTNPLKKDHPAVKLTAFGESIP